MRTFTIFGSVITSIVFISNVHADNNSVTQNELAAIYVLSEICPNLIGNSSKFTNGYQQFVKSYLPNESNPVEMLNQRAKSPNFQKYLIEERKAAKAASISENRQICEEVQAYAIPEKKEPIQNSTYTPSSTASSSMGASFLTGLLKTAVGVAVARQTGNNALGAQVALAQSPEELNSLTSQIASEARQHSDTEIGKQQAIRDQQARQLQEQQATMQRAQQQSSYGTVGSSNSSSSGSYGTISSGSSSNNYGNSSSTINNGQNNTNTSKPKKVAKSLNSCVSLDTKSNSLADFWIGHCGQHIWINWVDQGDCRTGCADSFTTKVSINKTKGQVRFAACPYGYSAYLPNAPQPSGYKWDGRSAFECRDW